MAEHHDCSILGVKGEEGVREGGGETWVVTNGPQLLVGIGMESLSPSPFPNLVDGSVGDDPVEPGAERSPPVEAAEGAQRGDERLLSDVLGAA